MCRRVLTRLLLAARCWPHGDEPDEHRAVERDVVQPAARVARAADLHETVLRFDDVREIGHHAALSGCAEASTKLGGGYRSGRRRCLGTPVAASTRSTHSAGTPRALRFSHSHTLDCDVPMARASGSCTLAAATALAKARWLAVIPLEMTGTPVKSTANSQRCKSARHR